MPLAEDDVLVDLESQDPFLKDIMRLYVWPEVARRQQTGLLPSPFGLERFQVLMWAPKGRRPKVLLNTEVKVIAEVKLTQGNAASAGETVSSSDIERICRIDLVDEPDAGHATLVQLNGVFYFFFDFRYNQSLARAHLLRATEFMAGAKSELDAQRCNAAVELLWSGAELTALSILLTHPDPAIMEKKSHKVRAEKLKVFGELNFTGQATLLGDLNGLRERARYVEGSEPLQQEVRRHFRRATKLIQYARRRLEPLRAEATDPLRGETN